MWSNRRKREGLRDACIMPPGRRPAVPRGSVARGSLGLGMDDPPVLLDDPVTFWDERHQALDPWRSGGDRGLTPDENREFYALRLAQLLRLIRHHHSCDRSLRILDAGCGRGHLTASLSDAGHEVIGVDSSPSAIGQARQDYRHTFVVHDLASFTPRIVFNVVICMDVLFHVLDDEVWRACVLTLARCAAVEATLIIADRFGADRQVKHDYIVHRTADEYDRVLNAEGFRRRAVEPYRFGTNPNAFAVYARRMGAS